MKQSFTVTVGYDAGRIRILFDDAKLSRETKAGKILVMFKDMLHDWLVSMFVRVSDELAERGVETEVTRTTKPAKKEEEGD